LKEANDLAILLAYAGIPYQVFGDRVGALAVTMAWIRLAMALSDPFISAIFASKAFSPFALRASAFSSWRRSFIAARSWAESPVDFFVVAVVLLADLCVAFFALIFRLLCLAVRSSPSTLPSGSPTWPRGGRWEAARS
jgi:hypothetical protein